jgi:hypothetical protein
LPCAVSQITYCTVANRRGYPRHSCEGLHTDQSVQTVSLSLCPRISQVLPTESIFYGGGFNFLVCTFWAAVPTYCPRLEAAARHGACGQFHGISYNMNEMYSRRLRTLPTAIASAFPLLRKLTLRQNYFFIHGRKVVFLIYLFGDTNADIICQDMRRVNELAKLKRLDNYRYLR